MTKLALVLRVILFASYSAIVSAQGLSLSYDPVVGAMTSTGFDIHLRTSTSATVQIRIDNRTTPRIQTTADTDFTARIPIQGLTPDTEYAYDVLLNRTRVITRTVRTFPDPGTPRTIRLVALADANLTSRHAAYIAALTERPDAILQLGDFPHGNPARILPISVTNWWAMHRDVLAASLFGPHVPASLAARSIPFVHTWDDHDYGENNTTRFAPWKRTALEAFEHYFPSYPRPNPESGLWQSFSIGSFVDVIVLDERFQKDKAGERDGPDHSILDGAQIPNGQKDWLKQTLLNSTATWKIILSSLAMNPTVPKTEGWASFPTERQELVNFVKNHGITGVLVVSGDIHSGGGIDNGKYAGLAEVSVPKTNLSNTSCTGGGCGVWSAGIGDPATMKGGYALLDVRLNGSMAITIKSENGSSLRSLVLNPH